jgi:hypothetical protein
LAADLLELPSTFICIELRSKQKGGAWRGVAEFRTVPLWEEYPYNPVFLRKSAVLIDSKRLALHSLLKERK